MVWSHVNCYNVLQDSHEPSKRLTSVDLRMFADATRTVYKCQYQEQREVMSATEGLFSEYTRDIIQDRFRQDLLKRLPVEILTMIAELLTPCWYLTVLGETRRLIEHLRDSGRTQSKQLRLTPEMWMSRITYRGTSYVAQLSSQPLEPAGLSLIKLPRKISKIVLSVDCIGIRGIQFVDPKSNPSSDGSPWYEILEARDADTEVDVNCDV